MPPVEVASFLDGLSPAVVAVYEAGPTGFGLARAARERGIDVRVAAPGSIPKGSADRVKTDRRDAIRLARLLAAGELSFAFVPSVADEHFRDLVRAIEDARGDLMRARHRLGKFLLRRGDRYPGPGRAWTAAHLPQGSASLPHSGMARVAGGARGVDFMIEALENDDLVHEAPAIVSRESPSALAHAAA
jgi:transposase